jgi:MFS family permease
VGRKRILITEFIFQSIAFIWLLFSTEVWMLFLFAVLFGLSSGGWTGVIAAFPADYFGYKATGSILGFAVILAGIGVAMGPYLGGYIYDTTHSYSYMVIMCIIATIAATISASFLRPPVRIPGSLRGH